MIALPAWLPEELWSEFLKMRKSIKRPATEFAQMLILKTLYQLKAEGHDPVACIEQSLINCWCDVYPLKAKKAERVAVSDVARTQAALKADELSARGIQREDLAENARRVREAVRQMKQRTLQ